MLSNNKFIGKCWYGGQPWKVLESESMVEKGINFIFCLGTAYDISMHGKYWELKVVFVGGMDTPPKMFLSLIFSL